MGIAKENINGYFCSPSMSNKVIVLFIGNPDFLSDGLIEKIGTPLHRLYYNYNRVNKSSECEVLHNLQEKIVHKA